MNNKDLNSFKKIIKNKKQILIVFPNNNNKVVPLSLALSLFLENLNYKVDICSPNFNFKEPIFFLKNYKNIQPFLNGLQQYVINFDLKNNGLKQITYDIINKKTLRIFISPEKNTFKNTDIQVHGLSYKYDLIISLETQNLKQLQNIYKENIVFFEQTPIINIDNNLDNELFGQLNLIDINAQAGAEIIFNLCQKTAFEYLDKDIATLLLTNLMLSTNNFNESKIKANLFNLASQLIDLGANRTYIIKNIQQNKKITTFKLWGKILSNLNFEPEYNLVWSLLTKEDFKLTNTDEAQLTEIINELIIKSPSAKIIVIFYEDLNTENQTNVLIRFNNNLNIKKIFSEFEYNSNNQEIYLKLQKINLLTASQQIINLIKQKINN